MGEDALDIAELLAGSSTDQRATIIDLLSVETEAERLALTARALTTLWRVAREAYSSALLNIDEPDFRVPTILVIDEAHNIIPVTRTSPAAERVAADLVRIAAEGRKFGLFLLLITQRPRKLDPNVLSECDALLLMKMTNASDLKSAQEIFGFLDPAAADVAKTLNVGDVLLQGRVGATDTIWHVAPRRTKQGGRSLDEKYWTSPFPAP
jgi:DNA helicase HerA-like ATPase